MSEKKEIKNITLKNEMGKITITKSIIGQIVVDEIDKFNGKVIMTNNKGKPVSKIYKSMGMEKYDMIQIEIDDTDISVYVYIITKLGLSIKTTTERLIEGIRESIYSATGCFVANINITVTGVLSKQIAKRNIKVERKYKKENGV